MLNNQDTIAAIATPIGRGGIGIVRVSGLLVTQIAQAILHKQPEARLACFANFYNQQQEIIDQGIALYFPAPNSFTGEDILELQGHGGAVVMDCVLQAVLQQGARLALPGEFSQRAFLNDKIDLTQAEAIADLIDSSSQQAAQAAMRSLQGEFSQKIQQMVEAVIHLRMYIEAAIDFPEEEIDFLADNKIQQQLQTIKQQLTQLQSSAKQGYLLQSGLHLVIAGRPNAGKSSLLNQLAKKDSAIVTDIPGTTRDILKEAIQLDGLPLHIIDTAGLRESDDKVEQEGIKRAWQQIQQADLILLMVDDREYQQQHHVAIESNLPSHIPKIIIRNKADLSQAPIGLTKTEPPECVISAKTGAGLTDLEHYLKQFIGYQTSEQGNFIARRRHLQALADAEQALTHGEQQLNLYQAGELLAEDLRQVQTYLNQITGEFNNDDLLGRIFSSFCIGK